VDRDGTLIAGTVEKKEEILYAEIDPGMTRSSRWMLDAAGHCARPDIFDLRVNIEPQYAMRVQDRALEESADISQHAQAITRGI